METVKKVSFTPGPWERVVSGQRIVSRHGYGDAFICLMDTSNESHEANAKLIESAPELLQALKMAMNQLHCLQDYAPGDMKADETPAWQKMKAAIARAEGMNPNE